MQHPDLARLLIGEFTDRRRSDLIEHANRLMLDRQPDEVIGRNNRAYLNRWYILRGALADGLLGNVYLHQLLRNDPEDMHCHPWWNTSYVLDGEYVERTPTGVFGRWAGDVVSRPADAKHTIIEVQPGTLTLFVTGPKEREWGFYPLVDGEEQFVHNRLYEQFLREHNIRQAA